MAAPTPKCHHPAGRCPALGTPKVVPLPEGPQREVVVPWGPQREPGCQTSLEGSKMLPFPGLVTWDHWSQVLVATSSLGVPTTCPQGFGRQLFPSLLASTEPGAASSWLCPPRQPQGCSGEGSSRRGRHPDPSTLTCLGDTKGDSVPAASRYCWGNEPKRGSGPWGPDPSSAGDLPNPPQPRGCKFLSKFLISCSKSRTRGRNETAPGAACAPLPVGSRENLTRAANPSASSTGDTPHTSGTERQSPPAGALRVPGPPGGAQSSPATGSPLQPPKRREAKETGDLHIKAGGRGEPKGRPEHFQRRQAACCVYYERTGSPVPSGSCTRKRDKFRGAEFPRRAQRQLGAGGKETKPGAVSTSRLPTPRIQPGSKFNGYSSKPPRQCQETPWPGTNSPPPQEQSKAAGCIVLQGAIKSSGKVSLEGGTGGCRCRQHPITRKDEGRGTHVCLSQQGGCTQAGGRCGFAAPARCRSAAEELEVTMLGPG